MEQNLPGKDKLFSVQSVFAVHFDFLWRLLLSIVLIIIAITISS